VLRGFADRAKRGKPAFTGSVVHPLIDQHRAEIATLCRQYGVRTLEVFGSAARGTDFDPDRSDADFLVVFEPPSGMSALHQHFGFAEELERLLGRKLDLAERGAIEKSRNYIRRRHILADAEPIYG
jgi:predicted nucleotidyltransferase